MRKNEKVSHIMTATPATVHTGQTLSEARSAMAEHSCHHMPVVSGHKLIGMLTSTDLLRVSYEYGVDPTQTDAVLDNTRSIEDVMSRELITIKPGDSVRSAAELFAANAFHALPVCDGEKLVGIVTTTDIVNYLLEQY